MRHIKISPTITERKDASLAMFIRDISKIPLITEDEEVSLSERVKQGDMAAANKLVEANLRFAISIAKQYQNKGLPLVDLIQSAIEGMIEASKRYDATKGFKFISYAVWWIRQSIIQSLSSESRTVRVPMNQIVCMNKLSKASEQFEQENSRLPTDEELESYTDISTDKIVLNGAAISKPLSLDIPFKDEEAGCLLDIIPNTNAINADNSLVETSISDKINEVLNNLSNREGDTLRMYFGISMEPMTLEEIACRFGIGTERVRQVIQEALEHLRMYYKDDLRELL